MHIPRITRLTAAICLLAVPALAAPWRIYSLNPGDYVTNNAYWGFPFELRASNAGSVITIQTVNGFLSPEYCDAFNDYDGSGINVHTPTTNVGVQAGLVGKILLNTSTQLFQDPRSGQRYFGAMYYDTQQHYTCTGLPCSEPNSKSIAYTNDGSAFTLGRPIMAQCTPAADGYCYGSDWWCDHGFYCDTSHNPRHWWITGDMSVLRVRDAFYAIGWIAYYNFPGQPLYSNPGIWTYTSVDGNTWQPYLQVNPNVGLYPLYYQADCLTGPWLINPDIAHNPQTDQYYVTRSYSTNYAGCANTLPDRVQLYTAYSANQLIYGPWTLLLDLGCDELGFQPDSWEFLHDGLGNIVYGPNGRITLVVGVSGAGWYHTTCQGMQASPAACGPPPSSRIYRVVVGP